MAKFYGVIGFGETVKTRPGVYETVITEHPYYGDVVRNSRKLDNTDQVNPNINLSVGNSVRIVADAYANEHFFAIRYIQWQGALWTVSNVDVEPPRLVLRLGGLYNGETPRASGNSGDTSGE